MSHQEQPHYLMLKHFGFTDDSINGKPALRKHLKGTRYCWVRGNSLDVLESMSSIPVVRYISHFDGIDQLDDKGMMCLLMAMGVFEQPKSNAVPLANLEVKEDGSITVLHIIEPVKA